uniref:CD209 antigen-like protein E n=1 Tax=Myodes glareolus TaxID=447135 RepID=UPI002021657F|nr:CD209 antigen-like protein E [Myodes glareolus]
MVQIMVLSCGVGLKSNQKEACYTYDIHASIMTVAVDMSCSTGEQLNYNEVTEVKADIGCVRHDLVPLVLQLLFLILFSGVLVAFLLQVPKVPCTQDQEKIYQELMQLKPKVDSLCRPCSWDWMFFSGNCYFFSITKRNWSDSLSACQEVGAQLIIIKSYEEQDFLQKMFKIRGSFWIGLSDMKHEGSWQWVDGSPLLSR